MNESPESPVMPPQWAIDAAIAMAEESPCAKSKRGVVLFLSGSQGCINHEGHNGPPGELDCRGDEACRTNCASYCIHAEQRAINQSGDILGNWHPVEALHVKIVDGKLVAGGGPSCLPCASAILDNWIDFFWLYIAEPAPTWRRYTAQEFYDATVEHVGLWTVQEANHLSSDEKFERRFADILEGIPESPHSEKEVRAAFERVMSGLVTLRSKPKE